MRCRTGATRARLQHGISTTAWVGDDRTVLSSTPFYLVGMDGPILRRLRACEKNGCCRRPEDRGSLSRTWLRRHSLIFLAHRCTKFVAVDFSSRGLMKPPPPSKLQMSHLTPSKRTSPTCPLKMMRLTWSTQPMLSITLTQWRVRHLRCKRRCASSGPEARRYSSWRIRSRFCSPIGSLRRVLAMTPGLNRVLNCLRAKPPLPYLPMPLDG